MWLAQCLPSNDHEVASGDAGNIDAERDRYRHSGIVKGDQEKASLLLAKHSALPLSCK